MTARPPASAGCCVESPPSRTVRISAISVVKPGIIIAAAPIGDRGQCDDARSHNRKQYLGPDNEADRTGKRRNSERSYPRGRTRRSLAFAAFPFSADQQANPKCHYQVEDHGFGYGDILASVERRALSQSVAA